MERLEEDIRRQGWSPVEFGLDISSREEFARRAHGLILLAAEEPVFAQALSYTIDPALQVGKNNPTSFGISGARNSDDDKLWLHSGYQSRARFAAAAPGLVDTPEVKEYFEAEGDVLDALESSFIASLGAISTNPEAIRRLFFPEDLDERVLVLRSVRYLNLNRAPVGKEVIEGHGDMSLATIQFSETHGNYLYAAPMSRDMIRWDVDRARVDYIRKLYGQLTPVEYDLQTKAAFFLSSAIAGLDHEAVSSGLGGDEPAAYHAGFRPEESRAHFTGEWLEDDVRMSNIGFLHPKLSIIRDRSIYRIPDVIACRPLKSISEG